MRFNIGGVKIKDGRQNQSFWEWWKAADFENRTQTAILKTRQKRQIVIIQVASWGLSPKEKSIKLKNRRTKQPTLIFVSYFFLNFQVQ